MSVRLTRPDAIRTRGHSGPVVFRSTLLLLVLFAGSAWAGPASGYRVAGIMTVGDTYVAVLALPDGSQVLVKKGSVVDGGRVVGFTPRTVRIAFPRGDVELTLDGSGAPASAPAASDKRVAAEKRRPPVLAPPETLHITAEAVRLLAASPAPAGASRDPGSQVAQRIAPVINLPPAARVVEINEQPVTDANSALNQVADTLVNNGTASLNIESPSGPRRIYVASPTPGR